MLNEFVEVIWPKDQHKESIRGVVRTVNDEGALHVEAYVQKIKNSKKWQKCSHQIYVAHPGYVNIIIIPGGPNMSGEEREYIEDTMLCSVDDGEA